MDGCYFKRPFPITRKQLVRVPIKVKGYNNVDTKKILIQEIGGGKMESWFCDFVISASSSLPCGNEGHNTRI